MFFDGKRERAESNRRLHLAASPEVCTGARCGLYLDVVCGVERLVEFGILVLFEMDKEQANMTVLCDIIDAALHVMFSPHEQI